MIPVISPLSMHDPDGRQDRHLDLCQVGLQLIQNTLQEGDLITWGWFHLHHGHLFATISILRKHQLLLLTLSRAPNSTPQMKLEKQQTLLTERPYTLEQQGQKLVPVPYSYSVTGQGRTPILTLA